MAKSSCLVIGFFFVVSVLLQSAGAAASSPDIGVCDPSRLVDIGNFYSSCDKCHPACVGNSYSAGSLPKSVVFGILITKNVHFVLNS
ncbi:hypothetical protein MKW92_014881 [Papaver armeniacum]|nr:hypothetical protein MKW92_014881 [Papaver armeniacum]